MVAAQLALDLAPAEPGGPPALGPVRRVVYSDSRSLLTKPTGAAGGMDFTLNPYSGCGFGCDYCYARFFRPEQPDRDAWGEWVQVKRNAVALIRRAARSASPEKRIGPGTTILMSSVTDPYQPIEAKLGLTRSIVEALLPIQPALTVHTRSPVVTRDLDLLTQLRYVSVNVSITTDSEDVRMRYEPHAPAIDARLRTAEAVARAGIPVCIFVSPMLPIRDIPGFARRLLATGAERFATQPLYPERGDFMSGSTGLALTKAREDRWEGARVAAAQDALAAALGGRLAIRFRPGEVRARAS